MSRTAKRERTKAWVSLAIGYAMCATVYANGLREKWIAVVASALSVLIYAGLAWSCQRQSKASKPRNVPSRQYFQQRPGTIVICTGCGNDWMTHTGPEFTCRFCCYCGVASTGFTQNGVFHGLNGLPSNP